MLICSRADDSLGDEAEAPDEESGHWKGEHAGVEMRSPDAEGDQEAPGQNHHVSRFQSSGIHWSAPERDKPASIAGTGEDSAKEL